MSNATIGLTRTAVSGEPIVAGHVFDVTPDGQPNLDWAGAYLFIQPAHLWRAEWMPEALATVRVVRDDNTNPSLHRACAPGLLGVVGHAVGGRFRLIPDGELHAAVAAIEEQMRTWADPSSAVVVLPAGFTVHIVPPNLVYGTRDAHRTAPRCCRPQRCEGHRHHASRRRRPAGHGRLRAVPALQPLDPGAPHRRQHDRPPTHRPPLPRHRPPQPGPARGGHADSPLPRDRPAQR
jgi:hypothetical protein